MAVKTEITIEELTEIAREFLRDNYGMELGIPIVRNNRLKTTMGRFDSTYENEPFAHTNPKPRTASNAQVKRFIDECFATYAPNAQYPGTSFGFSWAYRKNVWQRIQLEEQAQARRAEAIAESDSDNWAEVSEWL